MTAPADLGVLLEYSLALYEPRPASAEPGRRVYMYAGTKTSQTLTVEIKRPGRGEGRTTSVGRMYEVDCY